MKRGLILALVGVALLACGSPGPTGSPTPAPTPDLPSLPLPANIAGIPAQGESQIELEAHTPPGSVAVGVEQAYTLPHCGLVSPIDIDGSLWDPTFGDNGAGGPLTQDQLGDVINGTPVALVLVDHETMLMVTSHGARIVLTRHDGPRAYFGCD